MNIVIFVRKCIFKAPIFGIQVSMFFLGVCVCVFCGRLKALPAAYDCPYLFSD